MAGQQAHAPFTERANTEKTPILSKAWAVIFLRGSQLPVYCLQIGH